MVKEGGSLSLDWGVSTFSLQFGGLLREVSHLTELFLPKETIPTWEYSSHKRICGMDCVWVTAYLQITVLRSTGLCKPVQRNGSGVELELLGS